MIWPMNAYSARAGCLRGRSCLQPFYFFIFFGYIGSSLLRARSFSSCGERGYSSLRRVGFSLWCLLLLWSTGSRRSGFSSCGTWAPQLWLTGSRAQAQQLWRTGLVAPWHVGSSQTRARTRVPCIGRRILNHCTTREALQLSFRLMTPLPSPPGCTFHAPLSGMSLCR